MVINTKHYFVRYTKGRVDVRSRIHNLLDDPSHLCYTDVQSIKPLAMSSRLRGCQHQIPDRLRRTSCCAVAMEKSAFPYRMPLLDTSILIYSMPSLPCYSHGAKCDCMRQQHGRETTSVSPCEARLSRRPQPSIAPNSRHASCSKLGKPLRACLTSCSRWLYLCKRRRSRLRRKKSSVSQCDLRPRDRHFLLDPVSGFLVSLGSKW
jgi:hypothetical protein